MTQTRTPPASRRTALAPDLTTLEDRAVRAWTEQMRLRAIGNGRYAVTGESGRTHVVDLEYGRCSCPDHAIRDARCKHIRRVAIEISKGRIPSPGERAARCVNCRERAFVPVDADPPLCPECTLTPGEVVRDRETGDALVVEAVTGERAHQRAIPGTPYTVASYPTNRRYAPDAIVVEARYPGQDPGGSGAYAYPRSRLERPESETEPRDATGR